MSEKKLQKLDAEIEAYDQKKKYHFKDILNYFTIQITRLDTLKLLRTRGQIYYEFEDELRPIPLFGSIASQKSSFQRLYNIFLPFSKAANQKSYTIPLYLCTLYYIELEKPYKTVKINEKKSATRSYYTHIMLKENEILFTVDKLELSAVDKAFASKRKIKIDSKKSLGHTSFDRDRVARLEAEAKDPPGFLIVSDEKLPPVLGSYRYKSTQFHLYTKEGKAEEKCQIVIFDSVAEREVFYSKRNPAVPHFPCSFSLPAKKNG